MNKEVVVLSGAGSIGIAIVRRISAGKQIKAKKVFILQKRNWNKQVLKSQL